MGRRLLTVARLRRTLRVLFGRRGPVDDVELAELLPEMARFGITTAAQFQRLMKAHRRALLRAERCRLPHAEVRYYVETAPRSDLDRHANRLRYGLPALVREAMVMAFGQDAVVYGEMAREDAVELGQAWARDAAGDAAGWVLLDAFTADSAWWLAFEGNEGSMRVRVGWDGSVGGSDPPTRED